MRLGPLEAVHVPARGRRRATPVVLVHGLGLGSWIWERDQQILAAAGLGSYAVDLPGHGADAGNDVSLKEVADALLEAVGTLQGVALVGHSLGGLVAQMVAVRAELASLVLVAPAPPGNVPFVPTAAGVRSLAPAVTALVSGSPLKVPFDSYLASTLHVLPEGERRAVYDRINPWPNRLLKDMVRHRPELDPGQITCPVLVTYGGQDRTLRVQTVRLVSDLYDAKCWRFDDLAHIPSIEPGGERHMQKVAAWIRRPAGRRIQEIDQFAPHEGVGDELRDARRGGTRRRSLLHRGHRHGFEDR